MINFVKGFMYDFSVACINLFKYVTFPFIIAFDIVVYKIALYKCEGDAEMLDNFIRNDLRSKGADEPTIEHIIKLVKCKWF